MSTRTRRSAGGEAPALNPTMIQLLDVGRLRKELEMRGLPTNGTRQVLADRLSDAVLLGKAIEEPQPTPSPQAKKQSRKSNVKSEEIQESPASAPQTPKVEETIVPILPEEKDTPKNRKKRSNQAPKSDGPKKRKVQKLEVESESDDNTPLLSVLPSTVSNSGPHSKKESCTNDLAGPSTDSDDDIPLLSQLPTTKNDEATTGHKHGTRSKNLFSPTKDKEKPASKKVTEEVRLLGSDDFGESPPHSPVYLNTTVPSVLDKGDTDWKPEIKKKKDRRHSTSSKDKVERFEKKFPDKDRTEKVKLPRVPERRTVADEWAKLMAERSKQKEQGEKKSIPQISPSIHVLKSENHSEGHDKEIKPAEKRNEDKKIARPQLIKKSSSTNDTDLLESIMVDQSHLLGEKKRKIEEAEKEHERIMELRNAASSLGKAPIITSSSIESASVKRKASDPSLILPPPPPPPKKLPGNVQSPILPPPPPPKKIDSGVSRSVIPPPPAPPKVLAPTAPRVVPPPPPKGPIPEHIKVEKEKKKTISTEESNNSLGVSESESPSVPPPVEFENSANDNSLVVGVTQALLMLIQENKKKDEIIRNDVHDCVSFLIDQIVKHENEFQKRIFRKKTSGVNRDDEEYDPLETSTMSDFAEYIPSNVICKMDDSDQLTASSSHSSEDDDEDYSDISPHHDNDDISDEDEIEDSKLNIENKLRKDNKKDNGNVNIMLNPRDLLMKAKNVLESLNKPKDSDNTGPHYSQIPLEEEYEPEEPEKPAPEYHGEPVPSDDDDMLFEIAAGISKPKKKKEVVVEEEKLPSDETIEPDYYNADLHIKGAADKNWLIEPENADGLALMWGGVKSNYGIRLPFRNVRNDDDMEIDTPSGSLIAFQVKIIEFLSTKHLPFEELDPHDIRVGFSLREAPNILGENAHSYCITSLGKKAAANEFTDYGKPFHLNDVVTACIDLSNGSISYWINDEFMGEAFKNVSLPYENAVYPHISVKNCSVAVNFGDFPGGKQDWKENTSWRFPSSLGRGDLERSPKAPESKSECTVLMMVGLPGVGKTTWVRQYLRDHPSEQWTVIQQENVMAAMKINGISRRRAHHGRWDMVMGLIGKSLSRSVNLAARRRRNYIIDMSNTSREVRKKRLQLFEEFRRKCVIIIPSDDDMLDRQARQARHDGTAIMPPEAMLEMKALMSIPAPDAEPLDEVYFIEPPIARIQDAIDLVARYNEEARPWVQKKHRRRRAQNIGLGGEKDQSSVSQRKFTVSQPLTVLPPLRVSITPLDDSISPGMRSAGSAGSSVHAGVGCNSGTASSTVSPVMDTKHFPTPSVSTPNSAPPIPSSTPVQVFNIPPPASENIVSPAPATPTLGSSTVDRQQSSSTNFSVPPPPISSGSSQRPILRLKIEDLPPVQHATLSPPVPPVFDKEDVIELDEEEMRSLRESSKAKASSPMIAEAIMRAKLTKLQMKRREKAAATITSPTSVPESPTTQPLALNIPAVDSSGTMGGRRPSESLNSLSSPAFRAHTPLIPSPLVQSVHDVSFPPPTYGAPPPNQSYVATPSDVSVIPPPGLVQPNFGVPPPVIDTSIPPPVINLSQPVVNNGNQEMFWQQHQS